MLNAFLQSNGLSMPNFAPELSGGPATVQFGAPSTGGNAQGGDVGYSAYPTQMQAAFQPQLQPYTGATTIPGVPAQRAQPYGQPQLQSQQPYGQPMQQSAYQPMNWMTSPAARFGYGMYHQFQPRFGPRMQQMIQQYGQSAYL